MEKLYLREFIKKLKLRLHKFSREDLDSIIIEHAKCLSPDQRQEFLDIFATFQKAKPRKSIKIIKDSLLKEIKEFGDQAKNYEFTTGWGWDHEYRDERAWGDDSWVPEIDNLFGRIDDFYEAGNFKFAKHAYRMLLDIYYSGIEESYFSGYEYNSMIETDIQETQLKYYRCIYLTEETSSRPGILFDTISRRSWYSYDFSLEGMINVSLEDLPDWDKFGKLWIDFLKQQKGDKTVNRLLREAVRFFEGTRGLEELAKKKGQEFPGVYVDWLESLKKEKKYSEMLNAASMGLESLSETLEIRAKIADHFQAAAKVLKRDDLVLKSLKESLFADPSLLRLLNLLDISKNINQRIDFINEALSRFSIIKKRRANSKKQRFFINQSPDLSENNVPDTLEICCLLLKGDYKEAASHIKASKPLGWTHIEKSNAIIVSFFLYAKWNKKRPLTSNLDKLWKMSTEFDPTPFYYKEGVYLDKDIDSRFRSYIENTLKEFPLDEQEKENYFSSAKKVAYARINAIVSNKHRKSYWKAAELVLAIAEIFWSNSEFKKGQMLINHFQKKYNRHSAFQRELKNAIKESSLQFC